jgi:hypothetical protein
VTRIASLLEEVAEILICLKYQIALDVWKIAEILI